MLKSTGPTLIYEEHQSALNQPVLTIWGYVDVEHWF